MAPYDYAKELQRAEKAKQIEAKKLAAEAKKEHLESQLRAVDEVNRHLRERIEELSNLLECALSVESAKGVDSFRSTKEFVAPKVPTELSVPLVPPDKEAYVRMVRLPSFFEKAFRSSKRYESDLASALDRYKHDLSFYVDVERERKVRLAAFISAQERARADHARLAAERNRELDELDAAYKSGKSEAIVAYNTLVLERSAYPKGFPQRVRVAYLPDSREIVVDYLLPTLEIVPDVEEYKYVRARDAIDSKERKPSSIKLIYQDVVAAVALRTIHEMFASDQLGHLETAVFSGHVEAIDPANGQPIRPCLISLRTTRQSFESINLALVDKRVCLRNLGAHVSPSAYDLQPVKPLVVFEMVDKRFVGQGDILGELETRPNLMELTPFEFEGLVSNLFRKLGLEARLTRSSRDGGVDVIAFDTRPILGGKVVIQAKRYRHTVGVAAVRDLYGTMQHEGANKGILVTTSSYGPDAYEFSKDKPMEMIDGGGLLYLLNSVGIEARIVMPVE